jgi:hypothetical protein
MELDHRTERKGGKDCAANKSGGNVPAINKKGQRPSNLKLTLLWMPTLEDVFSNVFVIDSAVQPLP